MRQPVDVDRVVDDERRRDRWVRWRDDHVRDAQLFIVQQVLHFGDQCHRDAGGAKDRQPIGGRASAEGRLQFGDQRGRVRRARFVFGETGVGEQIGAFGGDDQRVKLDHGAHHIELQQPPVRGFEEGAVRADRHARAIVALRHNGLHERRLGETGVRPDSVRQQTRVNAAALTGAFAAQKRRHDGGVQGNGGRVVTHAGDGHAGGRAGRADEIHQAAPRPPGDAVEALQLRIWPCLAVRGQRGVDHPLVQRREVFVPQIQRPSSWERLVRDIHIAIGNQAHEDIAPFPGLQVERDAALVAAVRHPAVVNRRLWAKGEARELAVRVAKPWSFDLDHAGAEVAEDRCRNRPGDPGADVQHLEAGKDQV